MMVVVSLFRPLNFSYNDSNISQIQRCRLRASDGQSTFALMILLNYNHLATSTDKDRTPQFCIDHILRTSMTVATKAYQFGFVAPNSSHQRSNYQHFISPRPAKCLGACHAKNLPSTQPTAGDRRALP
ncbi:hypothetical protein M405DRAFT_110686 [Rhizopogon salebrosus TDB-379]|nr:hypothetical protein M405DRAFT_110686 [Rhizopogon salebrosus TDB-379]